MSREDRRAARDQTLLEAGEGMLAEAIASGDAKRAEQVRKNLEDFKKSLTPKETSNSDNIPSGQDTFNIPTNRPRPDIVPDKISPTAEFDRIAAEKILADIRGASDQYSPVIDPTINMDVRNLRAQNETTGEFNLNELPEEARPKEPQTEKPGFWKNIIKKLSGR